MKTIETLTPGEIAKILKLHPFTVTRLAREGRIPAFKVGGVWRIEKAEFESWVKKQHSKRKR
jgi:excisionase family DNA binding protein